MKPKIGLYGIWHPCDAVLAPEFEFTRLGSVWNLKAMTPQSLREVGDRYDLIILGMFGAPTWEKCQEALPLLGRKAKVVVWTLDTSTIGWVERERQWVNVFDGFFSSGNPSLRNHLGAKAEYLPCCLIWHGTNNLPVSGEDRNLDFASIYNYYPEHPRQAVLTKFAAFLAQQSYHWAMGQAGHEEVHCLYSATKVVINCSMDFVPNVRTFEALAAGAVCLQCAIPSAAWFNSLKPGSGLTTQVPGLFDHPRFSDLRGAGIEFNPYAINREVCDSALARWKQEPSRREIIRSKHALVHRYTEIAHRLLD